MVYLIVGLVIFAASFLFAMLGLGGGMVYVPVLAWAGFDLKEVAIPLGLLLNGLNTLLALIPFSRKQLVDWKGGLPMALAALVCAPAGAALAHDVPVSALTAAFAFFVVVAAVRMLWTSGQREATTMMPFMKRALIGVGVGAFAGLMGGLLGIGGGFIIAPVLMWMGYRTKEAAATTAFVVTFSSFSGYLGHVADGDMQWPLTIVVVLAVIIGSQMGATFMASRAKPSVVKQIYAFVLFAIAAKMLWGAL